MVVLQRVGSISKTSLGSTKKVFYQFPSKFPNPRDDRVSVTTRLVVLSNRLQFWKNWQKRRTPRRNVMGTTDRRGCLVPKHLEILKFGCWNRLSELCDGHVGRTVIGTTNRRDPPFQNTSKIWNWVLKIDSLNFVTEWKDGPSQAWRTVTEPSVKIHSLNLATTCRTDRRRHDGPSQVAQIPGRIEFPYTF